jgi:hypothetical protein
LARAKIVVESKPPENKMTAGASDLRGANLENAESELILVILRLKNKEAIYFVRGSI